MNILKPLCSWQASESPLPSFYHNFCLEAIKNPCFSSLRSSGEASLRSFTPLLWMWKPLWFCLLVWLFLLNLNSSNLFYSVHKAHSHQWNPTDGSPSLTFAFMFLLWCWDSCAFPRGISFLLTPWTKAAILSILLEWWCQMWSKWSYSSLPDYLSLSLQKYF